MILENDPDTRDEPTLLLGNETPNMLYTPLAYILIRQETLHAFYVC